MNNWFPLVTYLNHLLCFMLYLRGAEASDVGVLMEDPTVCRIANDHNKTPAHVLLKFLLQRGLIVLPKSVTPERVKANIEVCIIINIHRCCPSLGDFGWGWGQRFGTPCINKGVQFLAFQTAININNIKQYKIK